MVYCVKELSNHSLVPSILLLAYKYSMMVFEKTNIRALRRQLQSSKVRSESGQYFIPDISIASILSWPAINDALSALQSLPDDRIGLVERICQEGRKVFAILILISEEEYIVKFRNHGFLDDSLPISEADAQTVANDVGIHFANQQWELLSETFRSKMWENHRNIGTKRILPFINEPDYVGEGGFGDVVRAEILPSQQAFYPQDVSPQSPFPIKMGVFKVLIVLFFSPKRCT